MTAVAPFAAIEAALASDSMRMLANATATIEGGEPVLVIFDEEHAVASAGPLGLATTSPAVSILSASVPANPVGKALVVRSVNYTVAEHHPDGTGMSVLLLEKA
jgi:hypothetical protein